MSLPSNLVATTRDALSRWRVLGVACIAHVLHDGCSSMLYLLLPFWQSEFGLNLTEVGILKTVYSGAMAAGQLPAGRIGESRGEKAPLVMGTLLTAASLFALHWAATPFVLGLLLLAGGLGASVQHPLASALISKAYGGRGLRAVLGTYNFAGDLGKVVIPGLLAILIGTIGWRSGTEIIAVLAFATGMVLLLAIQPERAGLAADRQNKDARRNMLPEAARRRGFAALSAIGILDSATRTGLMTFLPFVLAGKGAHAALIGTALSLVFAGGAAGKFACGALATRIGILRTVILTEAGTAFAIVLTLALPLSLDLFLMPILGLALNGTSSVLYGTVPELARPGREARAFGFFYTVTIGADAVAPVLYGAIGDAIGLTRAMLIVAAVVLMVLPLLLFLRPALRDVEEPK